MRKEVLLALFAASCALLVHCVPVNKLPDSASCPCSDPSLCLPLSGPPVREKEIYGFGQPSTKFDYWKKYVTTVAWADDVSFTCEAHASGVRVVMASPQVVLTGDPAVRAQWINNTIASIQSKFMDGIVFDFEDPLPVGSPETEYYVALINETRIALHSINPSYQISTCVAWSPDDIDGRGYDMLGLTAASDLLYVMDYDTRSQIFDRCIASANSPLSGAMRGIQRYFDMGIPRDKLILGQPWYGYRYECTPSTSPTDKFCEIAFVPFRGVNCSDAAGSEHPYSELMHLLHSSSVTGRLWDNSTQSPYFNTVENNGTTVCQYWYDDVSSLGLKYEFAREAGLRGVGPFMFGYLDDAEETASRDMWSAFDVFLQ